MSKTNKKEPVLPLFGKPIFTISENNLYDKVDGIRRGISTCISSVKYYAADAVLVTSLRYLDSSMEKVIINEKTDSEMVIDVDKMSDTVYNSLEEANVVVNQLNLQQKEECKAIADAVLSAYNKMDEIIAASEVSA